MSHERLPRRRSVWLRERRGSEIFQRSAEIVLADLIGVVIAPHHAVVVVVVAGGDGGVGGVYVLVDATVLTDPTRFVRAVAAIQLDESRAKTVVQGSTYGSDTCQNVSTRERNRYDEHPPNVSGPSTPASTHPSPAPLYTPPSSSRKESLTDQRPMNYQAKRAPLRFLPHPPTKKPPGGYV